MARQGAARLYHCFQDESLNMALSAVVHRPMASIGVVAAPVVAHGAAPCCAVRRGRVIAPARPEPLPIHATGFLWATSNAILLAADGVPSHIDDDAGGMAMLGRAAKLLTDSVFCIPRTTAFVEVFSGMSGTARVVTATHRAFSFEREDFV
eukprot:5973474-Pyramimonas_sp.AAC.1